LANVRRVLVWLPAIAQMAVIFAASSVPNLTELPGGLNDHVGHFVGYALLSALVIFALAAGRWTGVTAGGCAGAVLISTAYGISDEFHQRFVAGRSPALDDIAADAAGALAAALLAPVARYVAVRLMRTRDV
jgi:VanZ family protein